MNADALVSTSRLTARVDNNAIVDGFQIYLHTFILTRAGEWAVVQQGLNEQRRTARRYHWHSATVRDFTSDPHTAIVGESAGVIRNLVDRHARPAQDAMFAIVHEPPDKIVTEVRKLTAPRHHEVRAENVDLRRLGGAGGCTSGVARLRVTAARREISGHGHQSLALVAEVVHGTPTRFADPARFHSRTEEKTATRFPCR